MQRRDRITYHLDNLPRYRSHFNARTGWERIYDYMTALNNTVTSKAKNITYPKPSIEGADEGWTFCWPAQIGVCSLSVLTKYSKSNQKTCNLKNMFWIEKEFFTRFNVPLANLTVTFKFFVSPDWLGSTNIVEPLIKRLFVWDLGASRDIITHLSPCTQLFEVGENHL